MRRVEPPRVGDRVQIRDRVLDEYRRFYGPEVEAAYVLEQIERTIGGGPVRAYLTLSDGRRIVVGRSQLKVLERAP